VLLTRDDARAVSVARPPGAAQETDLSWLDLTLLTALAPDGRSAILSEQSAGDRSSFDLQWRTTDGQPPKRIGEGLAGDLSPDGRSVVAVTFEPTPHLQLLPTGLGERRAVGRPEIAYRLARWFPDGRRLLTLGAERGKRERFWLESIDGATPRPLSEEGDWALGFVMGDSRSVVALELSGVLHVLALEPRGIEAQLQLSPLETIGGVNDRGEVYVYGRSSRPSLVELLDPRTGRRRPFAKLAPADPTGFVEVSRFLATPDGRSYAYTWYRQMSVLYVVHGLR
jgi:hypothetical protein